MAKRPNPIVQRISLEGADKIEADLKRLGKVGEATFAALKNAGGVDLAVGFQRQLAAIGKDFANVRRSFVDVGRAGAIFARNMSLIGVGIGAATAGVIAFTRAGTEAVDEAGKMAQQLGLSVDQYGRLAHAADQSGVSIDEFRTGLSILNRNTAQALAGNEKAIDQFGRLGVSLDELRSLTPEEVIQELADGFARLPDGAQKSALAMQLMGESGARLLPFLNSGKEGLRQLGEEAERLGIVFSEAQFKIAERFNDALARIALAGKGIGAQIAIAFAPSGTRLADAFTEALVRGKDTLTDFATAIASRVEPVLQDLLNTLTGNDADVVDRRFIEWRDGIVNFGREVQEVVTSVVVPAWRALRDTAEGVGDVINRFTGFDLSGTQVLMVAALGSITGAFSLLNATAKLALATIGFFARHPAIAAVLVLSGRMATLATQQSIADQAADEHKRALDDLDRAMAAVGTASSEARTRLRDEARASLDAAIAKRDLLKAAREELALALAIQKVDANPLVSPANRDTFIAAELENARAATDAYNAEQDKLVEGLRQRARELGKADRETVNLTQSTNEAAAAIEEAGEKARRAFPGPAANIRSVSDSPFAKVKQDAQEAGDEAETSGRKVETAFGRVVSATDTLGPAASRAGTETKAALDDAGTSAATLAENVRQVPVALTEAGTAATTALQPVQTAFVGIEAQATQTATTLPGLFTEAATAIAAAFTSAFARIQSELAAMASAVRSTLAGISASLAAVRQEIAATRAAAASAASAASGGGGGFASGGQVFGPGTSTSDSIPAWLSAGEFVVRAKAVDHYGPHIFAALNSLRLPRFDVPRFNAGGIVRTINDSIGALRFNGGGAVPAMAGAGNARNMGVLTLRAAPGDGFEVQGPVDVLETFSRAMNRAKLVGLQRPARLRG